MPNMLLGLPPINAVPLRWRVRYRAGLGHRAGGMSYNKIAPQPGTRGNEQRADSRYGETKTCPVIMTLRVGPVEPPAARQQ